MPAAFWEEANSLDASQNAGTVLQKKKNLRSANCSPQVWRRDGDSNPRSRFNGLHDFQSCSFDQLGHLSLWYSIFRTPDYYIQITTKCQGKSSKFNKNLSKKQTVPKPFSRTLGRNLFNTFFCAAPKSFLWYADRNPPAIPAGFPLK